MSVQISQATYLDVAGVSTALIDIAPPTATPDRAGAPPAPPPLPPLTHRPHGICLESQ